MDSLVEFVRSKRDRLLGELHDLAGEPGTGIKQSQVMAKAEALSEVLEAARRLRTDEEDEDE